MILVDRIGNVAIANGVVRVDCASASASGQEKPSGTLLIPAVVAGQVIQSLLNAMQELGQEGP